MNGEDEMKKTWQRGSVAASPTLDEIRASARSFETSIRRRNAREYTAGVLVVIWFAWMGLTSDRPIMNVACAAIVAGTIFVLSKLRRNGASEPLLGETPVMTHYRSQLERQRAALASVAWWYLLPLLPGLLIFMYAAAPTRAPWVSVISASLCAMIFIAVWWLNHRAARALEHKLAELDQL